MKRLRSTKRVPDCGLRNAQTAIFIGTLALGLLVMPFAADAQQPGKVHRIGYLGVNAFAPTEATHPQKCPMTGAQNWQAWLAGLREHGYIPGQNVVIDCRWTEGQAERAPALAVELASLKPDLLVVAYTVNVRAAKQATSTIPIVMVNVSNPVERGLVANLARPGGNVTGPTDTLLETQGKLLQLLKEAVPTISRVAVLSHPGVTPEPTFGRDRERAAQALGMTLQRYDIRDPADFAGAFAAMTRDKAEALFAVADSFWQAHIQWIVDLAAQSRLPAVYPWRNFVTAGGLMSYDVNRPAIFRRLGFYVDRILKGAKPGDLPVEQPTKFDLLINLKTAKALGLTIPQSLLMRADEVIE